MRVAAKARLMYYASRQSLVRGWVSLSYQSASGERSPLVIM